MPHIYVTGHRNPDTDTIASAIGYAELKGRLNPDETYKPVRLGEVNAQTRWALEKSGAREPDLLEHIMLRVKDVMKDVATAHRDEPLRNVGLVMAKRNVGQVPIVDDAGEIIGIVTERDLARMYIRESREPSTFATTPASVRSMVEVLEGELLVGEKNKETSGKLWVISMSVDSMGRAIDPGDIIVIGDRPKGQRKAIELGVGVLVVSNGIRPEDEVLRLAEEKGATVILSPLDSYVTSRMIQLSVPCWEVMSENPLTVHPEDLVADITPQVMEVHYRAAVAVDDDKAPVGILTRTDLLNPKPRRVLLVDHAERAQSVPGVEQAQIVEILDHHHIGNIETRTPIPATFEPVGSTATLILERYKASGLEPKESTAKMLLAAVLSDTVVLNSPTTTERDHEVVRYLEGLLDLDAKEFGMEMFGASSDVSGLSAEEIIGRDQKEYGLSGEGAMSISQIETVGPGLLGRKEELLEALERLRQKNGYLFAALMVTDIIAQGTELLCVGECAPVEQAFGTRAKDHVIELPGVMSRKKQVAPRLLAAF